jgi:NPCBM/NEW2 domain
MMLGLVAVTLAGIGQVRAGEWGIVAADHEPRTIKASELTLSPDVVSARRTDRPLPSWPEGRHAILADGTWLAGTLADGSDRAVTLKRPVGTVAVPFDALDVLWLTKPPAGTPVDPAKYVWLPTPRKKDVLLLASGDTLAGTLDRFEEKGSIVRFRADGQKESSPISTSSIAAIAFDPGLSRPKSAKGPVWAVTLADGSRVRFTTLAVAEETLKGRLATGGLVEWPLGDVIAIDVLNGKATYLSDLKPKSAKTDPYLALAWPFANNRNVKGSPLRLTTPRGEETFDRGLGTHPRTTLIYDLGGKYRRFTATVGLDAATGKKGRAVAKVLVDGKEAIIPGLADLSAAAAVPVSVDVTKAKELTFVVDFGPAGDVQADVNWADARVIE